MWVEILDSRTDIVHAGVVDVDPARLARFAQTHPDVPRFMRLGDALAETESDAVLLVTPPDGHLVQARAVFAARLPLLAEKPLTLDLAEARAMVRLADEAGLSLVVGLNFRYLPVSQKIRELVTGEAFGKLGFGHFFYPRHRDGRVPRLNKYPLTMRHPMMLEQSIHHLDLLRFCYGREVERIACRTWNPSWSMYAHDSNVACLLTFQDGVEVTYYGTWTGGWNGFEFQWRTDCERGIIIQRQLHADLAVARTEDTALTPVELPPCRAFYDDTSALLTRFIAHVRDGAPIECSGHDHLRTLALCFAGIESSETGTVVQMDDFYTRHGLAENGWQ